MTEANVPLWRALVVAEREECPEHGEHYRARLIVWQGECTGDCEPSTCTRLFHPEHDGRTFDRVEDALIYLMGQPDIHPGPIVI